MMEDSSASRQDTINGSSEEEVAVEPIPNTKEFSAAVLQLVHGGCTWSCRSSQSWNLVVDVMFLDGGWGQTLQVIYTKNYHWQCMLNVQKIYAKENSNCSFFSLMHGLMVLLRGFLLMILF